MEIIRVIRHYHWLAAGWGAVWVILLSLRIVTKSQSLWVRVLIPLRSQLVAQAFQPVQAQAKACGYQ
jgi:hypothetical protein